MRFFGDCSFETLDRLGAEHDVPRAEIRKAYACARAKHAAINEDMEERNFEVVAPPDV